MKVTIPQPLLSYTDQADRVEAAGGTLDELLHDLDRQYPGIRFRMINEQDEMRPHIIFFVGGFVYLAGGYFYNSSQKGLAGTDAIPNIEFWRELPTLVKDGCSFAYGKISGSGGGGGGESYSSVP